MKPVAWWTGKLDDYEDYMSERIRQAHEERGSFTPRDFPIPLYTADQLRAAQVAVLREAADYANRIKDRGVMHFHLLRMADELEKS